MADPKKKPANPLACMSPKFRVSFPNVFKAKSYEDGAPKFSLTMLFDKDTDLSLLKKAANAAARKKFGEDKTKHPKNLRSPFRDGEEKEHLDGYSGKIFVAATSPADRRPQVIDAKKSPITEEDGAFYAGCYARATLVAYGYDKAGNKGVAFGLQNVQKLGDGEAFSGRKNADDEFDAVEDDSDDEESYDDKDDSDDDEGGF